MKGSPGSDKSSERYRNKGGKNSGKYVARRAEKNKYLILAMAQHNFLIREDIKTINRVLFIDGDSLGPVPVRGMAEAFMDRYECSPRYEGDDEEELYSEVISSNSLGKCWRVMKKLTKENAALKLHLKWIRLLEKSLDLRLAGLISPATPGERENSRGRTYWY